MPNSKPDFAVRPAVLTGNRSKRGAARYGRMLASGSCTPTHHTRTILMVPESDAIFFMLLAHDPIDGVVIEGWPSYRTHHNGNRKKEEE